MSKQVNIILGSYLLFASFSVFAESFPSGVNELVPTLKTWGLDPVIVEAVKAQNQSGLTLEVIKARDEKWRSTDGIDDFMKGLMESQAAKRML